MVWISAIVFISYIIYIIFKYGIPSSISDSVYRTEKEWLFLLFTFGVGLPITFSTDIITLQIAGVLLTYVGLTPDFKNKDGIEDEVHSISAFAAGLLGLTSLLVDYGYWELALTSVVCMIPLIFLKNRLFWIELVAFITIITGLLW